MIENNGNNPSSTFINFLNSKNIDIKNKLSPWGMSSSDVDESLDTMNVYLKDESSVFKEANNTDQLKKEIDVIVRQVRKVPSTQIIIRDFIFTSLKKIIIKENIKKKSSNVTDATVDAEATVAWESIIEKSIQKTKSFEVSQNLIQQENQNRAHCVHKALSDADNFWDIMEMIVDPTSPLIHACIQTIPFHNAPLNHLVNSGLPLLLNQLDHTYKDYDSTASWLKTILPGIDNNHPKLIDNLNDICVSLHNNKTALCICKITIEVLLGLG